MGCPRSLARLRPSAVRVRIRSRSTSAKPPSTASINRPVLVPVSAHGSASDRNCALASTRLRAGVNTMWSVRAFRLLLFGVDRAINPGQFVAFKWWAAVKRTKEPAFFRRTIEHCARALS